MSTTIQTKSQHTDDTDSASTSGLSTSTQPDPGLASPEFQMPFLVRTKTDREKDQLRSEYHQQRRQTDASISGPRPHGLTNNVFSTFYHRVSMSWLLENKASVARDHLANERTFLAWLRTSLSLITVGVAITQLYQLNTVENGNKRLIGRALGGTFVALSIVFLYFANVRYFHAQYALTQNQFPASRGSVLVGSISVLCVLVAMFVVIITDKR
ncbi:hypothetical protein DM01DRAFT_252122 [Hesseltinella vesiculosa]|uniref:DUF202 domain-containing protein n=1 Tax=Hesseltinella vesiculosa TaxID=101127 RepID=A0A1X2GCZ5_9FUNG|nr:hypothetical protein DM01DRAFT_252122 [Hesseltinella vesiculosa]